MIEKEIEWPTLSFFAFLFIAVGAAVATGLIDTMANGLGWVINQGRDSLGLSPQGTILFAALMILWASGILSALIDNIPYVAVTIPIVARLIDTLPGHPNTLWWALALGACLGGNGTLIGASANVTTIGLAEKGGTRISFSEFTRFRRQRRDAHADCFFGISGGIRLPRGPPGVQGRPGRVCRRIMALRIVLRK